MKRFHLQTITGTIGLTLALAVMIAALPTDASACDNEIRIAPQTLNLRSSGTVVTVHTDVPYADVDAYSVYLSGVAIDTWKADDLGFFVAKFLMDDIKAIDGLVLNDSNTFQLVAVTVTGEPICGEAEVMIIDRGPQADRGRATSSND
ncbi:MAG: hypothetical protein PVG53_13855 [Holophagae bacterium]|jgi:hypothetical protein